MKTKRKEKVSSYLLSLLFISFGILLFLFIRGDFTVFLIDTDAANNLPEESVLIEDISHLSISSVEEIEDVKENNFVFFSSTWCGQCELMRNEILNIANTYDQKTINLFEVKIDNSRNFSTNYGIMTPPALLYFDENLEVTTSQNIRLNNIETIISSLIR